MKTILKCILAFLLVVFMSACSKEGIKGNGEVSTEQRALSPFTKIEIAGKFNIRLTGSRPESVAVTVDRNLQPYIQTKVQGDTLVVSVKDGKALLSDNEPVVTIRDPKITAIKLSGKTHLKGTEIVQDVFSLEGGGKNAVEMQGKVGVLNIDMHGSAEVNTVGLLAGVVNVKVSGSSEVSVRADKSLNIEISGSGKVRYAGNPVIQQQIRGSGQINAIK